MPRPASSMTSTPLSLSFENLTGDQQSAIDRLYAGNLLFIAPVGFGKHVCLQTAAEELLEDGELNRIIVLTTLKNATQVWGAEHLKWGHLHGVGVAVGTAEERMAVLQGDARIVVINNENVPWLMNEHRAEFRKLGFDGLIIDEISKYKTAGSKGVKALRPLIKDFKWRVGASATPVAECGADIYTQMLIIDNGASLGRNRDTFMRTYFMQMDYSGYSWSLQPGAQSRLAAAVAKSCLVADSTSYEASLPGLNGEVVEIPLNEDGWEAYQDMAKDMWIQLGFHDDAEAVNEAVLAGKLQQLASGFVYPSTNLPAVWFSRGKLIWLEKFLARSDSPVLIMYNFTAELTAIRGSRWGGGIPVYANNPAVLERRWNEGKLPAMLIHPKSGGHGLNLQAGGHTMVALGPCWSADDWRQVIGRLHRRGQEKDVTRITLCGEDTIDLDILDRLDGKKANEGLLMDHLKRMAQ